MLDVLVQRWWTYVLRGGLGLLCGMALLFGVEPGVRALAWLAGSWALLDGVFGVIASLDTEENYEWGTLLEGLAGAAVGMALLFWPGLSVGGLVGLLAARALTVGVLQGVTANLHFKPLPGGWLLLVAGLVSASSGIALFGTPTLGVVAWIVGGQLLVSGILLPLLGFQARRRNINNNCGSRSPRRSGTGVR